MGFVIEHTFEGKENGMSIFLFHKYFKEFPDGVQVPFLTDISKTTRNKKHTDIEESTNLVFRKFSHIKRHSTNIVFEHRIP